MGTEHINICLPCASTKPLLVIRLTRWFTLWMFITIFPQEPQGLLSELMNNVATMAMLKAWHRLNYVVSARVT